MKIDVITRTKNSEAVLEECLASIYKEIPVCHLIVIDGFSEDRTLEIIDKYDKNYGNVKVIQTEAKIGKVAEIAIKNVDTEWFAFIDSDAILQQGWFEKILKHIREEDTSIGAVESNVIHHYPESTPKFPEFKTVEDGKRIDSRALTIATLIRREIVEGIEIPADLPTYEDEFIMRYIEGKGFTWLKVVDPIVDHFPTSNPFKFAYLMGVCSIRYKLLSAWRIIIVTIFFPLKFFYFLCKTRALVASWNTVLFSFYMLKGLIDEVLGISSDKKP